MAERRLADRGGIQPLTIRGRQRFVAFTIEANGPRLR